ncbi:MAG: 4Fe-4S dicluster domain-containing protein [Candidatus Dormibacteraeota bacterium]|nr:4Fe-4S dicluster domain-containing protein [Candidatus Dormibacteraeota bacterium]
MADQFPQPGDDRGAAAGGARIVDGAGLDAVITGLRGRGYRTVGPTVRDRAISLAEISGVADLPRGWHDSQSPGSYRLSPGTDREIFGWAVGADSVKRQLLPPREVVWRAGASDLVPREEDPAEPVPLALVGVRPCEVAALRILDRVLGGGQVADPRYAARRQDLFVCTVECGSPASTCFCTSMGTGPGAESGFDLAITEILEDEEPRYLVRVGSDRGAMVLNEVESRPATPQDEAARREVLERAESQMGLRVVTDGLPELLERNLEHPRWDQVASRCLSCGNCTQVCPTCFCVSVEDITDLGGTAERRRRWASCFEVGHSYIHGGPVRPTTRSRYRQWATHKLGTWHAQFGTSGCVGCGRCIAWCPVGIDLREEVSAIRAGDGLRAVGPRSGGG